MFLQVDGSWLILVTQTVSFVLSNIYVVLNEGTHQNYGSHLCVSVVINECILVNSLSRYLMTILATKELL